MKRILVDSELFDLIVTKSKNYIVLDGFEDYLGNMKICLIDSDANFIVDVYENEIKKDENGNVITILKW